MAVAPLNEQFCRVGDVELCYETFGDAERPTVLLIMGLGTQMIAWHNDFCGELVDRGFHVVRYDNRDIGRSTHFDSFKPPGMWELITRKPRDPAYRLNDMADDGVGLLDYLGIDKAHIVGASMGGMIAQQVASQHPDRTLSLISIMSATGSRWSGQPAMRVLPAVLSPPPKDRDAYVERIVKLFKLVGSPGFPRDEEELRAMVALGWERDHDPNGTARQMGAILASGNRVKDLWRITAPTLVIHGTRDKLVAKSGGKATARAISGSRLMLIDGMGHDLPRGAWPQIIDGIAENAARAKQPEPARA